VCVGMSVGHSPSEPQWAPDMRKNEKDVTQADKEQAKRRIQGSVSVAPQDLHDLDGSEDEGARRRMSVAPTVNTLAASAM
jgi:phosphatidylserine decarboxylase